MSDLSLISGTAMPGNKILFTTTAGAAATNGVLKKVSAGWEWRAPDNPGMATLTFSKAGAVGRVQMFVLTPWQNGESAELGGYKIGKYSRQPFRGLRSYKAPTGFIELTDELVEQKISPHFTLGQFRCKQQPGFRPTYLLVHPGMLLKLEHLLAAANKIGWKANTFTVMSGFRTPYYNRAIGNTTTSSRHLFGGAADIFIDADRNGVMDDLNSDGKIDKLDAIALAKVAEDLAKDNPATWPAGGLAPYSANSAHGPFVHVDVRGYKARWSR
ncbi:MAG: D-Ala-D-Ala carboxypeptidase family metallohydrolase [Alphaproteobacteria bacterium]